MLRKHHDDSAKDIVSDFRAGHVAAFESIFHKLYARLCSFSLSYTRDNAATEEIVGDSFLIVWNKREQFKDINGLKSYLYTTVKNASLDYLKKSGEAIPIDINTPDSTKNMEFRMIEEETHSMLYSALDSLPAKCRRVFELSCLDGVKYQDIADEMQISLNTVKSQRARAIQLLKDHFKGQSFYTLFLSTL
ncbi:RNA polymerase sigma-70 factor [Reichenbachiella sp. MALMAid0571]|uniref:RNA polymerase sigma factor n=1 Tax=Reichenbachiella sp. MALMAid0571 TaxID=3143939 RepID=UPI0032DEA0CF